MKIFERYFGVVLIAPIFGFFFLISPPSAKAVDCQTDIVAAEKNLKIIEEKLPEIEEDRRKRIELFLADAQKMIKRAQRKCAVAESGWDRVEAKAHALIAQGNLAAAQLLVKEAQVSE